MNESELFLKKLDDKALECEKNYCVTYTSFMDENECAIAEAYLKKCNYTFVLYGGYTESERKICVFLPDYIDSIDNAFSNNDNPIEVFRVKNLDTNKALSHRDFLGSLMALGIKRNVIGDIIVYEGFADIIILSSISSFLKSEYNKAGRSPLETSIVSISELHVPELKIETIKESVASPRLDALVSAAFNLSRNDASEYIKAGKVFVNGIEDNKIDREIDINTKLVLRGKGKVILKRFEGQTRKGRTIVVFDRYK